MAPSITTTPIAGLWYTTGVDNTGGDPAFDLTLIKWNQVTLTSTLEDGSTSDLTEWLDDRIRLLLTSALTVDLLPVLQSLISIATVNNESTPANQLVVDLMDPNVQLFQVTIPSPYYGAFIWGMAHSVEGGFALPGCGAGGGGGGGGPPTGPAGGVLGYVEIDGTTNPSTYPNPNGLAPVVDDGGGTWRIPVRNDDPTKSAIAFGPDANSPLVGGTEAWIFRAPDGANTIDPAVDADDGVRAELIGGRGGDSLPNDPTATANGGDGATVYVIAGRGGDGGGGGGAAGGGGALILQSGDGGSAGAGAGGGPAADGADVQIEVGAGGTGSATQPAGKGGRLLLYGGNAGTDGGGGVGDGGDVLLKAGDRSDGGAAGNNGRILHDSVSSFAANQVINITAATDTFGFANSPVIIIDSNAAYVMAPAGKQLEDGGQDGDTVTIQNVGTFAITLRGEALAAGSNLLIGGGSSRQLSADGGNITLRWSDNFTKWIEIAFAGSVT